MNDELRQKMSDQIKEDVQREIDREIFRMIDGVVGDPKDWPLEEYMQMLKNLREERLKNEKVQSETM